MVTDDHISQIILYCSDDSIDFIFELTGMKATKKHFNILLGAIKGQEILIDKYQTILVKKDIEMLNLLYTIYKDGNTQNYTPEKTEVLIKHGFVPDIIDINLSVLKGKEIYNIERFGIVLDEKFLKLCQENNFYPQYNFKCIDPNLYKLQELCLKKNLPQIKQFLKKNKVVPDSVCLENASTVPNNKETIQLLVDAGGIITKSCVLEYAKITPDNQLRFLLSQYFKNTDK
jgi:hypothetical protein